MSAAPKRKRQAPPKAPPLHVHDTQLVYQGTQRICRVPRGVNAGEGVVLTARVGPDYIP